MMGVLEFIGWSINVYILIGNADFGFMGFGVWIELVLNVRKIIFFVKIFL